MHETKNVRTPLAVLAKDFLHGPLSIAVWLACIAMAGFLLDRRVRRFRYTGVARAEEYTISAPQPGTIEEVLVDLYEEVEAGAVVAVLDTKALEARIQTASAMVDQLAKEVQASRTSLTGASSQAQSEWQAELRSFCIDEQALCLRNLELAVTLEADRIKLERWGLREERTTELVEAAIVAQEDLDEIRLRIAELESDIERNEILLSRIEREHEEAARRRAEFEAELPLWAEETAVLSPLEEAIRVQSLRVSEIQLERRGLVLRAPIDGFVTRLIGHRGQNVAPGETVALVADPKTAEVVCFLPARSLRGLDVGDEVLVWRMDGSGTVARSRVSRASPSIEALPQQLWLDTARPEFGRPLLVSGIEDLLLFPGERVIVREP